MAPAYLVASFGKLLRWAGDTAIVPIFGAIATGLAGEQDRGAQVSTPAVPTIPAVLGGTGIPGTLGASYTLDTLAVSRGSSCWVLAS